MRTRCLHERTRSECGTCNVKTLPTGTKRCVCGDVIPSDVKMPCPSCKDFWRRDHVERGHARRMRIHYRVALMQVNGELPELPYDEPDEPAEQPKRLERFPLTVGDIREWQRASVLEYRDEKRSDLNRALAYQTLQIMVQDLLDQE